MTTIEERILLAGKSRQSLNTWIREVLKELSPTSDIALVNIWGCRGCGKSTWLNRLASELSGSPGMDVLTVLDADRVSTHKLADCIFTELPADPDGKKYIVLIDNLKTISEDDGSDLPEFIEFERNTLLKLIQRSDVFLVITSVHELRHWHHFEIKMRQASLLLPPTDRKQIWELASLTQLSLQKVEEITCGYPLAMAYLKEHPTADGQQVALHVIDTVLGHLPDKARMTAMVASLLVDFDVAVLQKAMLSIGMNMTDTYLDRVSAIQKIGIQGLIFHEIRQGNYRFTLPSLRRLLARSYQIKEPEKFKAIHEQMASFYKQEARRSAYLPHFLVNVMYHLAWSNAWGGRNQSAEACVKWFSENVQTFTGVDWENVLKAWQTGRGKPEIVHEIESLIGKQTFSQISSLIENARRS